MDCVDMNLDQVRYTADGKKIGEGSEMRILSVREAESERYQFYGQNKNHIHYDSIEEFVEDITNGN